MHHLLKLFNIGHYKSVYNNLLKQQLEQENVGNQLTQELLQENNIAVCLSLMRESHTNGSNKENVNFLSILKKCYSIPANKQSLISELTVLYNIIYNKLVSDKLYEDLQCYNYIYKTCHRVLVSTSIGQKTKKSDFLNYSDVKVAVWSAIQKCLTVLQLQTDTGILEAFLWLALILCVKEIKINQCAIVKQCLSDIYKIVTKGQITLDNNDTDTLVLRLPLCIDHVELNSNITEVFQQVSSLLLSICLTDTKSWDEIVKLLDTNNGGSAKSVSQFFLGFTLYKQDRLTDSVSCLMEVLRCTDNMTQRLKARVCNLIGQCFMKLDKSHLSVQMFKEALCADFSYLLPLYNTSLQYKQQGMDILELECLNLLSTALEMRSSSLTKDTRVDLLSLLDTEDADIQYEFVLYSLAYRTLQLERYEISSEKYMQLIEHLKSRNVCLKFQDKSRIPSVVQIHHEAIESLFKSEKFTECVNLCDKLILCYHGNQSNQTVLLSQTLDQSFLSQSQINWNDSLIMEQSCTPVALNNTLTGSQTGNQSFSQPRNQSFSQTGTQSGKKRKHCEITESQKDDDEGNIDIVALRYKAECLHKMGDSTTALSCLQSALDSITSSRRRKLHQCMNKITDRVNLEPNSKKQKTGSTPSLVQDAEVLPQSTTNNNVVDILDDSLASLKLERTLYEKTAEILTSLKQTKDAQHFSRLADQIKFVEQKKG